MQQEIEELKEKIRIQKTFNAHGILDKQIEELEKQLDLLQKKKEEEECEIEDLQGVWNIPMNTEPFIIQDKDIDYKTLALVMVGSKYKGEKVCEMLEIDYSEMENHRYFYKKAIKENKEELEKMSTWKIKTIQRNINKLATNGNGLIKVCQDEKGRIYYKIYPYISEQGITVLGRYVKVDSRILKYLINVYNSTTIKVYCTLLWKLRDGERQITFEEIAKAIGLKVGESSKGNLTTIKDIMFTFDEIGLIKQTPYNYIKETVDGDVLIRSYKYSLTTEEFLKKIIKK